MKDVDKPWYKSKMVIIFFVVLGVEVLILLGIALLAGFERTVPQALGEVATGFSTAITIALPVLLSAKGWADVEAVKRGTREAHRELPLEGI